MSSAKQNRKKRKSKPAAKTAPKRKATPKREPVKPAAKATPKRKPAAKAAPKRKPSVRAKHSAVSDKLLQVYRHTFEKFRGAFREYSLQEEIHVRRNADGTIDAQVILDRGDSALSADTWRQIILDVEDAYVPIPGAFAQLAFTLDQARLSSVQEERAAKDRETAAMFGAGFQPSNAPRMYPLRFRHMPFIPTYGGRDIPAAFIAGREVSTNIANALGSDAIKGVVFHATNRPPQGHWKQKPWASVNRNRPKRRKRRSV